MPEKITSYVIFSVADPDWTVYADIIIFTGSRQAAVKDCIVPGVLLLLILPVGST